MGPFWGSIFCVYGGEWHIDILLVVYIYAENLLNVFSFLSVGIYIGIFMGRYTPKMSKIKLMGGLNRVLRGLLAYMSWKNQAYICRNRAHKENNGIYMLSTISTYMPEYKKQSDFEQTKP